MLSAIKIVFVNRSYMSSAPCNSIINPRTYNYRRPGFTRLFSGRRVTVINLTRKLF